MYLAIFYLCLYSCSSDSLSHVIDLIVGGGGGGGGKHILRFD